ncbi:hypothetical protein RRG08_006761 [Elysia crispata]|uniref:Uncharacterized protein n=1 Tax=Elysia crispata TaxID=231223 RepID=A0AAE1D9W7_9GAST|nr:hypothetical protein RRG08_006761 [Elysia crispata]
MSYPTNPVFIMSASRAQWELQENHLVSMLLVQTIFGIKVKSLDNEWPSAVTILSSAYFEAKISLSFVHRPSGRHARGSREIIVTVSRQHQDLRVEGWRGADPMTPGCVLP